MYTIKNSIEELEGFCLLILELHKAFYTLKIVPQQMPVQINILFRLPQVNSKKIENLKCQF